MTAIVPRHPETQTDISLFAHPQTRESNATVLPATQKLPLRCFGGDRSRTFLFFRKWMRPLAPSGLAPAAALDLEKRKHMLQFATRKVFSLSWICYSTKYPQYSTKYRSLCPSQAFSTNTQSSPPPGQRKAAFGSQTQDSCPPSSRPSYRTTASLGMTEKKRKNKKLL